MHVSYCSIAENIESKKAALNNLLVTRQPKATLVQQGIITTSTFGSPLEVLVHERGIPLLLVRAVSYLELKGRGNIKSYYCHLITSLAREVGDLFQVTVDPADLANAKQAIQGGNLNIGSVTEDPHVVASLIVEFFKDLPDPLFPYSVHSKFISWIGTMLHAGDHILIDADIDDYQYKVSALRSLINCMPSEYRQVLSYLVSFLHRYVSRFELDVSQAAVNKICEVFGYVNCYVARH